MLLELVPLEELLLLLGCHHNVFRYLHRANTTPREFITALARNHQPCIFKARGGRPGKKKDTNLGPLCVCAGILVHVL